MCTIHYSICTLIAKFIYLFLFNKLFLLGRIIFFTLDSISVDLLIYISNYFIRLIIDLLWHICYF